MMPLTTLCLSSLVTLAAPVESVAVDVDASSIKPEGPGITRQLGDKVTKALADQGIAVDDASARQLRIEVRQTGFISYDVTFVVEVDGVVIQPGIENVTCEKCPLAKMDAAVVAKLPEAIALMEKAAKTEPHAPAATQDPGELALGAERAASEAAGPAEAVEDPAQRRSSKALGPVGISGIVVGAGGLALTAAGIAKMVEPPTVEQDVRTPEYDVTEDPERTGRALLGVGIATALVGGVLIAVDATVLWRKRQALARMPRVVPGIGSLVIKGRF
jgi:hypothetical protein